MFYLVFFLLVFDFGTGTGTAPFWRTCLGFAVALGEEGCVMLCAVLDWAALA